MATVLEKGLVLNKVGLLWENSHYKYLYAKEDIQEGEVIYEVPQDLIFKMDELCEKEPTLDAMNNEGKLTFLLSSPWRSIFFAMWLHLMKTNGSEEHGWILDELEPDLTTTPRFFGKTQLKALEGSSLTKLIELIVYEGHRDHLVLTEMVDCTKGKISADDMVLMKYYARRTCFPIMYPSGNLQPCYVPCSHLVSMTQHLDLINVKWDTQAGQPLRLIAKQDIPFGEAIRQQGQTQPCNFDNMSNFGNLHGVPDENENNTTCFVSEIKTTDPMYQEKLVLLDISEQNRNKLKKLPALDHRVCHAFNDFQMFRTLSWLRIVTFEGDINELNRSKHQVTAQAIQKWKNKGGSEEEFHKEHKFTGQELGPVTAEAELAALNYLVR